MYKCKHCGKEFDDKRKLAGHSTHCKLNPKYEHNMECLAEARTHVQNHTNGEFNKEEIQHCQYCGKECHSKNSLLNHERLCKFNPNRDECNLKNFNHQGHKAWNKGLTSETDERVSNNGKSISISYRSGKSKIWCSGLTKETDVRLQHMSDETKRKMKNGEWKPRTGGVPKYEYKGCVLQGSWEYLFAIYLDEHNIRWEQITEPFEYEWNGGIHHYYPDFYLPTCDVYVEIKGLLRERDIAKWETLINVHHKKLNVYNLADLIEMGVQLEKNKIQEIPEKFKFKEQIY